MQLQLFRHLWGVDEPWETVFPKIKQAGYAGIETHLLPELEQRQRFAGLLQQHGFKYIAMIFTAGESVSEHVASFRRQVQETLPFHPLLITCHSGQDSWSEEESADYFTQALQIEAEYGIPVAHETHRGRILYQPWITSRLLQRFENLKLCCDFSHWVCVCERLIDDQLPIIQQCAERALHLHARVGYNQGPQVPDPRAPEYRAELAAHERWWDLIWDAQQKQGQHTSTLTPEFGPPPYLHTLPHTDAPVANLWDICNWQAKRQADRFAIRGSAGKRDR